MFARDLHQLLATFSLLGMGAVTVEGGVRAARGAAPSMWASRTFGALLLLVAVTAAGGLALLVGGHRPRELLHLLYAVLAFGAVPVADSVGRGWSPRGRALARTGGAVVGIALIVRLFATG
jgi:hypothetical protein